MDNIKKLADEELQEVNRGLNLVFESKNEVFFELNKFLSSPNKRIRSLVTLLYLKANNKNITKEIINILIAGELVHNASLLHDDVIDNAELRRGEVTIGKKFSSHISILAGDYLLSQAIDKLLPLNNIKIIEIFQDCTKKMSEAEIHQYCLRGSKPEFYDYINICKGKTASLFEAILCSSVLILGEDVNKAKNFAENFGILFQIKNDLEENSAKTDKNNEIFTIKDIMTIEKTKSLIDNYMEEIRDEIRSLPDNIYQKGLDGLLNLL